jgi:hypothetical protein
MRAERIQGLVVAIDPLTVRYRERIAELAVKSRLPTVLVSESLPTPEG